MPKHVPVAFACLLAAACASPQGAFPSLAMRDAERVTGSLQPAEPYVPQEPSAATESTVESLLQQANAAYEGYQSKLEAARSAALAARGAAVGSDAWATASVALAELETERSRTMIPLADLDRLVVDASTAGDSTFGLADAQALIEEMVEFETAKINEIHAALGD